MRRYAQAVAVLMSFLVFACTVLDLGNGSSEIPLEIGDGEHRVGQDIWPGTYRSLSGKASIPDCDWRVEGGSSYGSSADKLGRMMVFIKPEQKLFVSQGCGQWEFTGQGTLRVGVDIEPGEYMSEPLNGLDQSCTWSTWNRERTGRANDHGEIESGRVYAEVKPTDHTFSTFGCKPWELVSSKTYETPAPTPTPKPRRIGEGEHIVGIDIEPGLYESEAIDLEQSCYYETLDEDGYRNEWGGTIGGTLWAWGKPQVEIKVTDHVFYTRGCKPWRLVKE